MFILLLSENGSNFSAKSVWDWDKMFVTNAANELLLKLDRTSRTDVISSDRNKENE